MDKTSDSEDISCISAALCGHFLYELLIWRQDTVQEGFRKLLFLLSIDALVYKKAQSDAFTAKNLLLFSTGDRLTYSYGIKKRFLDSMING